MDDIYIYITNLPDGLNEAVLPCADGYTVYINEKLDHLHRSKALHHAMQHISNNDWGKTNIQDIEGNAHTET